jgi:hypothetical protein
LASKPGSEIKTTAGGMRSPVCLTSRQNASASGSLAAAITRSGPSARRFIASSRLLASPTENPACRKVRSRIRRIDSSLSTIRIACAPLSSLRCGSIAAAAPQYMRHFRQRFPHYKL